MRTKLELNEIEELSLLVNRAKQNNKGTSYEALYETIYQKLLKMFDEEHNATNE